MPTLDDLERDLYDTTSQDWTSARVRQQVLTTADKLGLDPAISLALTHQESQFNPAARSPTGVEGLLQVTNATGQRYGQTPATRTDPAVSIRAGLTYFRDLLKETRGDVRAALMRYNGGSDPEYAERVMARVPLHQASLRGPGQRQAHGQTLDELEQAIYGQAPSAPSAPAPPRPLAREIAQAEAELERARVASPEEAAATVAEYRTLFSPYGELLPQQPDALPDSAPVGYEAPSPLDVATWNTRRRVPQILIEKGDEPSSEAPQTSYQAPPSMVMTDADKAVYDRRVKDAAKDVAANTLDVLAETGGAAVGGLLTLNPLGAIGGALVGSQAAQRFNVATGLRDPSLLGEGLAVVGPLLPAVKPAARAIGRAIGPTGRASRALAAHEASEAARTLAYQEKRALADQAVTAKHEKMVAQWEAAGRKADDKAMADFTDAQMRYRDLRAQADESDRLAQETYAALQQARADAQAASAAEQAAYQQRLTTAEQDYTDALARFTADEQAQADALTKVRALPERYMPKMPADLPPARGERPPPAPELVDPYYRADGSLKVPLNTAPLRELELQDVLRQIDERGRFGVKLKDEELFEELDVLLGRAESGAGKAGSGKQILKNDKSGLTSDAWAQKLHEEGFLDSPDVESFLRALDDSVRGGRPVYSKFKTPPEVVQALGPQAAREVAEDAAVSAKLYARLADYGDAPVYGDLIRSEKFDELLAEVEPLSKISPSAGRIQAILTTLKTTDNTDVKTVHRMLKDLRPLTSAKNGEVRYVAMRAMDILSDAVEKTADLGIEGTKAAGILMREARKAFRREKAVETLRHHFRDAGPVVSKDAQGRTVVNVKALMNSVDKLAASDPYFRGSFSAQEFQQLKDDIGRFAGTPAMPTKRPVRTAPEDVAKPKVVTIPEEPVPPTPEPRPTPPGRPRVPQRPPRPERPPVREEPYEPGRGPETYLRKPRLSRTLRTANTPAALVALGIGPWDYVSYALAKRLLTPQGRQKLARLMSSDGTMTAANMRKLMLGMQIPKATLQREARERRRDNERRAGERTRRRAQERQEFEALQRRRGF